MQFRLEFQSVDLSSVLQSRVKTLRREACDAFSLQFLSDESGEAPDFDNIGHGAVE